MTNAAEAETRPERDLVQKVVGVMYDVSSLALILWDVRYVLIWRLTYFRRVSGCKGGGPLLHVSLCTIKSWSASGICRLLRDMTVDPVLASVATGGLTEID